MGRKAKQLSGNSLINSYFSILIDQIGGIGRQVVESVHAPGQYRHQQHAEHDSRRAGAAGHLTLTLLGQAGHIHHDDSHIVVTAQTVGLVHELRGAALRVARVLENFLDLGVFQHGGQAVGTQKQTVACLHVDLEQVGLGARVAAQRASDDRALGVHPGLGLGNLPRLDKIGHKRMVAGELLELPLVQQIGTRVAHLGDDQAFFLQDSGSAGAAHTRTAHTLPCRLDNSQVRLFHRLAERGRIGVVGRALRDNIYGDLRGHLAGGVAAHAVAHRVQRGHHDATARESSLWSRTQPTSVRLPKVELAFFRPFERAITGSSHEYRHHRW